MASSNEPIVHTVYEPTTGTWQYIVADEHTRRAAVIDSVLDFDPAKNEISTKTADDLLERIATDGYVVEAVLETHLHADHLSAASYLCERLKQKHEVVPKICIGSGIAKMQKLFASRYAVPDEEWQNAFDNTYPDGATFPIGNLEVEVLHLPGHTPDSVGYQIGRNVFTGDSIFNPDLGSARCDFPEGSAAALWKPMQRLLRLPPDYRLYTGHDYPPSDRVGEEGTGKPKAYATVEEHRASNKHVKVGTSEATFIDWREKRDAGLNEPRLINQALQFNIRGGRMPKKSSAGDRLIHIPLKIPQSLAVA
jgi:glyoxylase-like metal-dependent hydrolase (beta-lactamase superfamily II)